MSICWLASYPRSGNTWLRHLVFEYFSGPAESTTQVAQAIPYVSELSAAAPCLHSADRLRFVKSHQLSRPGSHPHLSATRAAVYLVRHPKDVLKSAYNFAMMNNPAQRHITPSQCAEHFIHYSGLKSWQDQGMGNYVENVAAWLHFCRTVPSCLIRYEDLRNDTASCLRKILELFDPPIDPQRLDLAVRNASLERLRTLEETERNESDCLLSQSQNIQNSPRRFFNTGRSSGSLHDFAPEWEEAFDEKFGDIMELLGYDDRSVDINAA